MAAPAYSMMKRLLASECEAVVEALAIESKIEAGELHARLTNGASVVVAIRGAKRGIWLDKADLSGGDMLELVHRTLGKEDHRVAYDWGKRFFGLRDTEALAARRRVVARRQVTELDVKQDHASRVRSAIARYLSGGSLPWGCSPQLISYLATRGTDIAALPGLPKPLRFSPCQRHVETKRDWPAMLAPIVDPLLRQIISVHVTFLTEQGGAWHKAPISPVKKVSAPYKGGVIPLFRGGSGKPLMAAPEGDTALIAEGIENALAAAWMLAPGRGGIDPAPRVFAAIAAPNLQHVKLPPQFAEVVLICDRDPFANRAVAGAYDAAERAWLEAGLAVSRQLPPVGFKDFAAAAAHYAGR